MGWWCFKIMKKSLGFPILTGPSMLLPLSPPGSPWEPGAAGPSRAAHTAARREPWSGAAAGPELRRRRSQQNLPLSAGKTYLQEHHGTHKNPEWCKVCSHTASSTKTASTWEPEAGLDLWHWVCPRGGVRYSHSLRSGKPSGSCIGLGEN